MVRNQAFLFLIFTFNGVFIGLIFDFFRILRQGFKTANFMTYIEDILFWMIAGLSIIYSMVNFSNGTLRFFMVIGLVIGFLTYILTVSKYIRSFSLSIINTLKKFVKVILGIIIYPIKLVYKIIIIPIRNFLSKIYYNIKKLHFSTKTKMQSNQLLSKTKIKLKKIKKSSKKRGIFLKKVEK